MVGWHHRLSGHEFEQALGVGDGQGGLVCCSPWIAKSWTQLSELNNTRDNFTHGHHQMINTEIRLITFFVAKDGEAVYSQQKQDLELTVAEVINSP